MKIEIKEENHTFCNAMRKELWEDSDLAFSGYNIDHPLVSSPILAVHTKTKTPKKVLLDAVKRLKDKNKKLKVLFKEI